ncbi:MAG TPA: HAMP domain-containing sensor histidine kinase [Anaeromyxobacteraceae bacterium]|nr:HAMP domain-containing sensor histidine kinase [Anaeromyxobacteraceae bacterium]
MRRLPPGYLVFALILFGTLAVGFTGLALLVHVRTWAIEAASAQQALVVEARAHLLGAELRRLGTELERLSRLPEFDAPGRGMEAKARVLQAARQDFRVLSMTVALLRADGSVAWAEPPGLPADAAGRVSAGQGAGVGRAAVRFEPRGVTAVAGTPGGEAIAAFLALDPGLFGDDLSHAAGDEGSVALLLSTDGAVAHVVASAGAAPPPGVAGAAGQAWMGGPAGRSWLVTVSPVGEGPLRLRLVQTAEQLERAVDRFLDRLVITLGAALLLAVAGGALLAIVLGRLETAQRELDLSRDLAAMGRAATAISHEVKNSLNGISVAVDFLASERASAGAARSVHAQAREELERLRYVAEDLTLFSAEPRLTLAPVDLQDLAERAAASLRPIAAGLDATIAVASPQAAGPVVIRGDDRKLFGAVQNLVRNGLEAMAQEAPAGPRDGGSPPRGRRILVRTTLDGEWGSIEVADSGPGVPVEVRSRLFQPFATTKQAGTGLGLTIVRRIVEAHGGRVEAGDGPGGGAVFRMDLPLWPGATGAATRAPRPAP